MKLYQALQKCIIAGLLMISLVTRSARGFIAKAPFGRLSITSSNPRFLASAVSPQELSDIKERIKAKGDEIRVLKENGTAKDELAPHVQELLSLKSQLPPDDKDAPKPKKAPSTKESTKKKAPIAELSESELRQNRLGKVELIREAGMEPFEYTFDRTHSASALADLYDGTLENGQEDESMVVAVAGRIMTRRIFGKKLAFFTLQDETGTIQLQFDSKRLEDSFKVRAGCGTRNL